MDYYGTPARDGYEIVFTTDGRIGILQGQECVSLEAEEAEELLKELRRFLDDYGSGVISPIAPPSEAS